MILTGEQTWWARLRFWPFSNLSETTGYHCYLEPRHWKKKVAERRGFSISSPLVMTRCFPLAKFLRWAKEASCRAEIGNKTQNWSVSGAVGKPILSSPLKAFVWIHIQSTKHSETILSEWQNRIAPNGVKEHNPWKTFHVVNFNLTINRRPQG